MTLLKRLIAMPVAALLLPGGLATAMDTGGLDADAHCRQEATDYGIEPELVSDYIAGCVQAMGGNVDIMQDAVAMEEDGMPPPPEEVELDAAEPVEVPAGRESE